MAASRFSRRASPAGFHHTASLPSSSAVTACPIPTARAPTGTRRNSAPSSASEPCAAADWTAPHSTAAAATAARSPDALDRRRLIDQHDRDVIANGVAKPARATDEARFALLVFQLALALGADEDRQELGGQRHLALSPGSRKPKRRSADALRRQLGRTFTQRSRYTGAPTSSSTFTRAERPISRSRAPLLPIRIPFWLSRST